MILESGEARANEAKLIKSMKSLLNELRAIKVQKLEVQDALEKNGTMTLVDGVGLLVTQLTLPTTRASLQKDQLTGGLRQELTAQVYGLAEALSQVKDLELRLNSFDKELKILVNPSNSSRDLYDKYLADLTNYNTAARYVRALQSVMQGISLLGVPNWAWNGVYRVHDDLEGVELIKAFDSTWKEKEFKLCHDFPSHPRSSLYLARPDSIPGFCNLTGCHTSTTSTHQTRRSGDSDSSAGFGSIPQ